MSPVIGTIVGALIALCGVFLTALATDRRERRNRLWDKRAEIFVDALQFLYDVRLYDPPANREAGDPHDYWGQYSRHGARIAVLGDHEVKDAFERAAKPSNPNYYEMPTKAMWSYEDVVSFEDLVHDRLTDEKRKRRAPGSSPARPSLGRLTGWRGRKQNRPPPESSYYEAYASHQQPAQRDR